ncbi:uncharacterized protein LOC125833287 [Solanum verrucosum]|uniref:uncharacterized protein LOC125833287 n=1 Tax=Solanum verrucosum TaxID=315347 RepID=UPI0020D181D3|nr:uncharacterized protein LOC125833287 [Solanum verrucosum]
MKKGITEFVAMCQNCQQVKYEHQRHASLLQQMSIPEWKWKRIVMDFIVGVPKTLGKFDSIWVVVDKLTKSTHFIPVRVDYNAQQLAKVYVKEIVRLHRVPLSIISDGGTQFTQPFESLYGRGCRSPIGWFKIGYVKPLGVDLVKDAQDKVRSIQAKLLAALSRQKICIPLGKGHDISAGEQVLLKVSPIKGVMRFGKKGNLSPQYIGPFEILDCVGPVVYRLALPPSLSEVHLLFHVSMLKKYHGDED